MTEEKRALSFTAALAAGFEPKNYDYLSVPEGSWAGTLDLKAWGRSMSLHCYFTTAAQQRYQLTAFRGRKNDGIYGPGG